MTNLGAVEAFDIGKDPTDKRSQEGERTNWV